MYKIGADNDGGFHYYNSMNEYDIKTLIRNLIAEGFKGWEHEINTNTRRQRVYKNIVFENDFIYITHHPEDHLPLCRGNIDVNKLRLIFFNDDYDDDKPWGPYVKKTIQELQNILIDLQNKNERITKNDGTRSTTWST